MRAAFRDAETERLLATHGLRLPVPVPHSDSVIHDAVLARLTLLIVPLPCRTGGPSAELLARSVLESETFRHVVRLDS